MIEKKVTDATTASDSQEISPLTPAVSSPAELTHGPHKPLSEVFRELPSYSKDDHIYMGDIFLRLAGRGHALLFVVLGIPATLIPGVAIGFGIAILLLSLQMAFGKPPFLPKFLRERKMRLSLFERIQPRLIRYSERLQKLLHPRQPELFQPPWKLRAYGALIALLAFLLCLPLPIPFSNMVAGIPIMVIGLALLERDGRFLIAGLSLATLTVLLFGGLFTGVAFLGIEGTKEVIERLRPHF